MPDAGEQRVQAYVAESRSDRLEYDIELASAALHQTELQLQEEREKVEHLEELLAERAGYLAELAALAERENTAQIALRRAEREVGEALRRRDRVDVQANRTRRGKMVKVVVDPDAWSAWRSHSRLDLRQPIGATVGQLVVTEARLSTAAGRTEAQPASSSTCEIRALRIFVDEEVWPFAVLIAEQSNLTIGRYVGQLVERASQELHSSRSRRCESTT